MSCLFWIQFSCQTNFPSFSVTIRPSAHGIYSITGVLPSLGMIVLCPVLLLWATVDGYGYGLLNGPSRSWLLGFFFFLQTSLSAVPPTLGHLPEYLHTVPDLPLKCLAGVTYSKQPIATPHQLVLRWDSSFSTQERSEWFLLLHLELTSLLVSLNRKRR